VKDMARAGKDMARAGKSPEIVIPQLVEKVAKVAKTDLERLKFLKHLRIFSKLRNFEPLINNIMENTIAYFGLKDEDDYMYKKAEAIQQKRFEQNQRFNVIRLIDMMMPEAQIVKALDVPHTFVQSIQMHLAAAPKKIARMKKAKSAEYIAQELNVPVSWVAKFML
jgi:hypothetical protein